MFDKNSVQRGITAYSFDGAKIGTIGEVGANHFKSNTGFLGLGKKLLHSIQQY
jgi:hypothetical protein